MKTKLNVRQLMIAGVVALIGLPISASAQLEEVSSKRRSAQKSHERSYRFTAQAQSDTVTIKVINPRGEMQVLPVHAAEVEANGQLNFQLNTTHWLPGTYHIVAEGKHKMYSRRLKIFPTEPSNEPLIKN